MKRLAGLALFASTMSAFSAPMVIGERNLDVKSNLYRPSLEQMVENSRVVTVKESEVIDESFVQVQKMDESDLPENVIKVTKVSKIVTETVEQIEFDEEQAERYKKMSYLVLSGANSKDLSGFHKKIDGMNGYYTQHLQSDSGEPYNERSTDLPIVIQKAMKAVPDDYETMTYDNEGLNESCNTTYEIDRENSSAKNKSSKGFKLRVNTRTSCAFSLSENPMLKELIEISQKETDLIPNKLKKKLIGLENGSVEDEITLEERKIMLKAGGNLPDKIVEEIALASNTFDGEISVSFLPLRYLTLIRLKSSKFKEKFEDLKENGTMRILPLTFSSYGNLIEAYSDGKSVECQKEVIDMNQQFGGFVDVNLKNRVEYSCVAIIQEDLLKQGSL